MIFYDSANPAPNPRRVRMFAAEKGLDLPTKLISIPAREQKSPEFLAINPHGQTPALQLDDGSVLTESVAICRYLEALYPDKPLFGVTPAQIGAIEMWIRRVELTVMEPVGKYWVHSHPYTAKLQIQKFPEYGENSRIRALDSFAICDAALANSAYLAGDDFTMADITLFSTVEFAAFIGIAMPDEMEQLRGWHQRVAARPSASR